MSMTDGQWRALDEVRAIVRTSDGAIELISQAPGDGMFGLEPGTLVIEVSIDCSSIPRTDTGLKLRSRERLRIHVAPNFPYAIPSVATAHDRWAGTPHVNWGRWPCLYQAVADWDIQAGMYGYMSRLWLWLTRAAAGELDPADAPLHPPFVMAIWGTPINVRADTPDVSDTPWVGYAQLDLRSESRVDVVDWHNLGWQRAEQTPHAVTVLLSSPFRANYPTTVQALFQALGQVGLSADLFRRLIWLTAAGSKEGTPAYFVLGTPMRRGPDGSVQHHIAVWEIPSALADPLRTSSMPVGDAPAARAARQDAFADLEEGSLRWCRVSEDRPQIVTRRDDESPVAAAFAGKRVVVLGCGAIGAHVAEWVARAGASELALFDKDDVSLGVLLRQPFTDADVGKSKTHVVRDRIQAIYPDRIVTATRDDVVAGLLAQPEWAKDADIVIDATANAAVRLRLEASRKEHARPFPTLCTMLIGHRAERALAVTTPPRYSGAGEDALRQVRLECSLRRELRSFADEFWPSARRPPFQPEPGCSEPTFRGSGAEVAALSALLLAAVSTDVLVEDANARGRLVSLPNADHSGRREATLTFAPAFAIQDSVEDYEIRLSASALSEIRGWIAKGQRSGDPHAETGGVLHGRLDETTKIVWIDTASGPPPDSVMHATTFVCGTAGVAAMSDERAARSRGELAYLGMWHSHPAMSSAPSLKDVGSMLGFIYEEARKATMLIAGGVPGREDLGAYVFDQDTIAGADKPISLTVRHAPAHPPTAAVPRRDIGLALSGGGSRAIAFHLGCLRALHDRGLLSRARVVSGVSGGALMTALYAYGPDDFAAFDRSVTDLLQAGLHGEIARRILDPRHVSRSLPSRVAAGSASLAAWSAAQVTGRTVTSSVRRTRSRTDAFIDVLREHLGELPMSTSRRDSGLDVVINACDLRSGTAVRFGSRGSTSSRYGTLSDSVDIATAVAASAAYPLLLPALDRRWTFTRRDGTQHTERILLTDGGVYDNSGTSCLAPGRSAAHTGNVFPVDYIIACDAGRGRLAESLPTHIGPRIARAFNASFRKLQDASRSSLHNFDEHGELRGFVMPYLGQVDERLPLRPPDLVSREAVMDYPTNFRAMPEDDLKALTQRGEQLTRLLIERWCPEL